MPEQSNSKLKENPMKKVFLLFLALTSSLLAPTILAETSNNLQNPITKNAEQNEIVHNKYSMKNARKALATVKNIMITVTCIYLIKTLILKNGVLLQEHMYLWNINHR